MKIPCSSCEGGYKEVPDGARHGHILSCVKCAARSMWANPNQSLYNLYQMAGMSDAQRQVFLSLATDNELFRFSCDVRCAMDCLDDLGRQAESAINGRQSRRN